MDRQGRQGQDRAGFTLTEVLIGSLILGLVLVSVMALSSQAVGFLRDIRYRARSSQVLQQRMEDIRLLNWTQLQAAPLTFRDPAADGGFYSGTLTRTAFDWYHGTATVVEVTLAVTWTNRTGQVQTNSLSSLVGQGGLNKFIF